MKIKEIVVNEIIKRMESGKLIWQCPYFFKQKQNYISKKPYRGINRWILADYSDSYYLTFNQIKKLNGTLKKGSKGIKVIFWKNVDNSENAEKDYWLLRYYIVFKQSDITGIDFKTEAQNSEAKCIESIDSDIAKTGAIIENKNCIPHYNTLSNIIGIPNKNQFKTTLDYYATLFHELIHWTGGASNLNRFKKEDNLILSNKESYSKEELVAEIGSAMLNNFYNLKPDYKNNAAYIQSWITYLKNNQNEIFSAASKSEKAFNFIQEKIN